MAEATPLFPGLSLRHPPENLAAEAALLGALLHNNAARERCLTLRPEHFANDENARVYARIIDRIDAGATVSGVTLAGEFGSPLIANLLASMIGIKNVPELAQAVQECFRRRQLIEIGESLVTRAFAGDQTEEVAIQAAGRIDALATGTSAGTGIMLGAAVDGAVAAIEEARTREGPAGISTGFKALDERIGGLEPGTLTVLAGRPGMGKSALGFQIAINAARSGVGVLMVSLEMSSRELGRRALATAARVPITAMKYGRVSNDQASSIVKAQRELRELPLTIEDSAGSTAAMIAGKARSIKRKGLGLVVVDHLHIVRPDDIDAKAGPTWAVGRISGAMKRLAKDCGVPVLLLAQLNRGVEGREDKRPGLGDLRQAGDIEQDADAVGFVYRPEYYMDNKPERKPGELDPAYVGRVGQWMADKEQVAGKAEVIFAKVRDGEPGTNNLIFDGPTTTFRESIDG